MSEDVLAWWFSGGPTGRRGVPPRGSVAVHEGDLRVGEAGLHASASPLAALAHARGPFVCRVRLSGRVVADGDRLCAERREVISSLDARDALAAFERWCFGRAAEALRAHALDPPEGLSTFAMDGAPGDDASRRARVAEIGAALDEAHARLLRAAGALREAEWRVQERASDEPLAAHRMAVAHARALVAVAETMHRALEDDLIPGKTAEAMARAFAWLSCAEASPEDLDACFESARERALARMDEELERRLVTCTTAPAPDAIEEGTGTPPGDEGARRSSWAPRPRPPSDVLGFGPLRRHGAWISCRSCGLAFGSHDRCPFCGQRPWSRASTAGTAGEALDPRAGLADLAFDWREQQARSEREALERAARARPLVARCTACGAVLTRWQADEGAVCTFCGTWAALELSR